MTQLTVLSLGAGVQSTVMRWNGDQIVMAEQAMEMTK